MTVKEAIYARKATRVLQKDKPIDRAVLDEILETAGRASSWSNSQPWEVYVVQGEALDKLRAAWKEEFANGMVPARSDIPMPGYNDWDDAPRCVENMAAWKPHRIKSVAEYGMTEAEYGAAGFKGLLEFYYAPVQIILGVQKSLTPYSYVDLGSYATTLMLAAKEKGIDSMPAFSPVYFADRLREVVDIPEDINAVFGIGLGYAEDCVYNKPVAERMPLEKFVKYFE